MRQVVQREGHCHGSQVGHQGCVLYLLAVMPPVGGWVSKLCCSDVVEAVDIDLDVVVLSLVSHYVRVHVHVEQALLVAVMRAAYAALRARALGRSPGGHEVDCSWQTAAFKLAQYSCDNDILIEGI